MHRVVPGFGIQMQGAVALMQKLHRQSVIHPGAVPQGGAGVGVDIQILPRFRVSMSVSRKNSEEFFRVSRLAACQSRRRTYMVLPAAVRACSTM
jgi:hypothetical protein